LEHNLHSPEVYDFRQYDRIWQRVAPGLDPYPADETSSEQQLTTVQTAATSLSSPQRNNVADLRQDAQLPGAEVNPCCLGSAAMEMLEVLAGFIEDALSDQRQITALARQAPAWAKSNLRSLAAETGDNAQHLMAIYYLITGGCYHPNVVCSSRHIERWCPELRKRYHTAACSGLNYARSAEGTTDPCLRRIFNDLSNTSYRHADCFLSMLKRSLRG